MRILKKLFKSKRPILKNEDIPNFEKVTKFVMWFIKNEPHVNVISNRSSNIIFNEGYRPKSGTENNPELVNPNINSIAEWFILKIFIDLNKFKNVNKNEFRDLIDALDETSQDTLITTSEIASKYNINFDHFVYKREIEKIPDGPERELFKSNFLADNVLAAEVRILAWLYHEYFNEWYKIKEKRHDEN